MFTADVANVIQLTDNNNADLFESLKQAYFNVRYKDGYKADIGTAKALYGVIKQLMEVAEKVYARHLLTEGL
nr:hypothetical protein [Mucilaginibacter hurinus]